MTSSFSSWRRSADFIAVGLAFCMVVIGCGGGVKAPKTADGKPAEILLVFDANINEKDSEKTQAEQHRIARWMEKDLTTRFKEGGYFVTAGDDPSLFSPGKGKFLLTIKIVEYTPASETSREEAGLGAGTTIIDTYAELFVDNHTIPRYRLKKGEVSARDWMYCAKTVTGSVAKHLSKIMNELY